MAKIIWDENGKRVHPYVPELREALRQGKVSRREFLRTATLLGLSASTAYAVAGVAGEGAVAPVVGAQPAKKGGSLRIAMRVREMDDPAVVNSVTQSNQYRAVLEYLTQTGVDNVTRPYLAESWEASDDLKTWTLSLRKDVRWSNGDAFTADDVVFNFRRWLDSKVGSSNLGLFASLTDSIETGKTDKNGKPVVEKRMTEGAVEKIDDHTVRLHLNTPELAIPENLSNYTTPIVHRRFADEGGNFAQNPIGTGPFALASNVVGEECTLRRRDDYWGTPAHLDQARYIELGEDPAASLAALASGQVDLTYETAIVHIDAAERIKNVVLHEAITAQTGVARMQVDKAPFDDRRVRQAIAACMDHQQLLALGYRGRGAPAENHHVAPIHPEYFKLPPLKQDYARARQLLAEAGHADGLTVKIDVASVTGPWELDVIQALKQQCEPAGITIEINPLPGAAFWDIWLDTPFGFTPWTHRPLGVMTLNLAYRSGVPWNESHYANPRFDAALDEASGILDADDRRRKMEEVERILQEDAVIAQPLWRSVFSAARANVKGYRMHPTQYHDLAQVWLG